MGTASERQAKSLVFVRISRATHSARLAFGNSDCCGAALPSLGKPLSDSRGMKALRRSFLDGLAAVSLFLSIAAGAAWPVSLTHPTSWSQYGQWGRYSLANKDGIISFQWHHGRSEKDWPIDLIDPVSFAGVTYDRGVGIYVPFAHVILLLLMLPVVRAVGWWGRTRRRDARLCAKCGYDLRATPGRCPECGEVVGESSAA